MASTSSIGASCPSGGQFYICQNNSTEFVGCCITDPCADGFGRCSQHDLRPASFSSDSYEDIPPQLCGNDPEAKWYTCAFTKPPFMGCCKDTNPCDTGSCPANDLVPAQLTSDTYGRLVFTEEALETSTATSGAAASTISLTSSTSSESTTGPTAGTNDGGGGLHVGAIVGIAIASTIAALAILAFLVLRCRRNRRRQGATESQSGGMSPGTTQGPPAAGGYTGGYTPIPGIRTHDTFDMAAALGITHGAPTVTTPEYSGFPSDDNTLGARQEQNVSDISKWSYSSTQFPSTVASPDLAELSGAESRPLGTTRYSELPAEASAVPNLLAAGAQSESRLHNDELHMWTAVGSGHTRGMKLSVRLIRAGGPSRVTALTYQELPS